MSDILAAYTDKKYMYDLLKADLYTPDRVWISLQEELENVRSDVQMKVHKKVNMELTCDGVDKLYGDKLLVRELFFALLENAARYMPEESTVRIRSFKEDKNPVILFSNASEELTKDQIKNLTEPYYRIDKAASRRMGGQGFGLPVADQIMRVHQGRMELEYKEHTMNVRLYFTKHA